MNRQLVSVVLPVYNSSAFLTESIRSILDQDYPNFELIIINDGSTDDSDAVIKSFVDDRIRYFHHPANRGLIAVLNEGLGLAKGELIARMDADDRALPQRLSLQVNEFLKDKELGFCGTAYVSVSEHGRKQHRFTANDAMIRSELFFRCPIAHPTVMFRRSAIAVTGPYDPAFPSAEDYELWTRMAMAGLRSKNITIPLLEYRIHEQQITQKKFEQKEDSFHRAALKYLEHYNVKLDRSETEVFRLLLNGHYCPDNETLKLFESLLTKILNNANVDTNPLKKTVEQTWASVCLRSLDRRAAFRTFSGSSLGRNVSLKLKVLLKSLVG